MSGGENKETRIKPWEYQQKFHREDVKGSMEIVLSNLVYVDTKNMEGRLQNQIRRMAAFLNSVYFKNQRIGYTNITMFILSHINISRFLIIGIANSLILKID